MSRKSDIVTLKKRAAFLAVAASGKKWVTPGMIVQIKPNVHEKNDEKPVLHYGLTASSKVGNAVKRNRAKRRLRALAREVLAVHAPPEHDYVLIARPATVTRDYADLRNDMTIALKRLKVYL